MQVSHGCLESSILSILWEKEARGEYKNSVKDVYDFLKNNEREKRAYTTIKTVMDRLFEKKLLLRFKDGRKFYYRTVYSNSEIVAKSLCELANRYCFGDLNRLVLALENLLTEKRLMNV